MGFFKSGLFLASQLAWPVAGAAALAAAVFDPSTTERLDPGTRVREIQEHGAGWTWVVVDRTDDGRYELRRGTVLMLAEPWELVAAE